MEGTIKSIAMDRETGRRKGFGFIQPAGGGPQVFFHHSAVKNCRWDDVHEGLAVTYDPEDGTKGPRAENVNVRGGR